MLKKMLRLDLLLFVACLWTANSLAATTSTTELAADVITIKTPQVEMVAHNATSTEVIMDLDNKGTKRHELIAAFSPVAKQVLLHKTIDKKMDMEPVKAIIIAPHHEADLRVNSFHIMLIGLTKTLNRGDIVPIVLIFKDGSWIRLKVPVT